MLMAKRNDCWGILNAALSGHFATGGEVKDRSWLE
jgi:hypothetical protein